MVWRVLGCGWPLSGPQGRFWALWRCFGCKGVPMPRLSGTIHASTAPRQGDRSPPTAMAAASAAFGSTSLRRLTDPLRVFVAAVAAMLVEADPPRGLWPISLRQGETWNRLPLRSFRISRHTKTGPSHARLNRGLEAKHLGKLLHHVQGWVSLA